MKKNYKVRITETLTMTVDVEAHSRDEAEQIASDNWHNSDYILDADTLSESSLKRPRKNRSGRKITERNAERRNGAARVQACR